MCNPNGGPSIPLQDHFQGWELIHFASKAKRYGLLDNDARLALYEAGRLRMRGESLNHLLLGRVESALSALIDADLGAAECDRGECDACGRLAVLGPESTPPPVPAAPVVALEEPASPISPDVGALLTISYTPERIPELAFSRRDAEVLDKVRGGLVESPSAWALHYQARLLGLQSGFDRLLCLPLLRDVRHYDYQKNTALKVLREMRGRAILADEVGLGKTIEAGIILKELLVRGLAKKVLILTPASLATQWREEMERKFGIDFEIVDELEDWARHDRVISSIDTAKRDVHKEEIQKLSYDVVVVDEAHKLKNRYTKNWKLVAAIRKKYMLLLTATPVQNDLEELFNLVTLLRPGQLSSPGGFRLRFVRRGDRRVPVNTTELKRLLREVMIRNRRSNVLVLPPRRVFPAEMSLSKAERKLYEEVTAFVRARYSGDGVASRSLNKLALFVLQKEMGSSTFAAAATLRKMKDSPNFPYEDRLAIGELYESAVSIRENAKAKGLLELLNRLEGKAIVFTQYLRTLEHLRSLLEADGHTISLYHGGLPPWEKDASVRAFQERNRVFLSTEAGGEGRNLQFCNTVVNFDLPWNPLKIEQRIGRVHRLGQTREVYIVNLWAKDTVEEYVIELLDRKINMFHLVVGELDLILGNLDRPKAFEEVLMDIWTIQDLARREAELQAFGEELLAARTRYESVKLYEEGLFGSDLAVEAPP
ncbi:MAG TPA: SNF2-related protein [Thermoplasmata archaeon]|nr:SNF2-related protein [Thermoplasmata archaeon]